MADTLQKFKDYLEELSYYDHVVTQLQWDLQTQTPEKGYEKKIEVMTHFSTEAFKMLTAEEVVEFTGHAIGGVCAFGINNPAVKIYCDDSLKRFETVFPACGSSNSAIEFTCDELFKYSNSLEWIDVAKLPEVQE